ncbi:MAG: SDR family oxidoreductase [Rubrivivax sp.]|nr:SDR family oxidoreductase [Rubrivivax sp.]
MELGINGRRALVCASTQGLGHACALALADEGCEVWINGRNAARLASAAEQIRRATHGRVHMVQADLNTEGGREALLAACPAPDILVTNHPGPAPGQAADWDRNGLAAAFESYFVAAVLLMRAVLPGMRERRFGRIVNVANSLRAHNGAFVLTSAARAGLAAAGKALAREAAADNVTINNLQPERFDTARQEFLARRMMAELGLTRDQARQRLADSLPARRLGRPEEFGAACAFLCSANAGFITGQDLRLDGGAATVVV